MTREELTEIGFVPKLCKIGTLYFRGAFFGILNDNGELDLRSITNDMKSIGIAKSANEIKDLEKSYYVNLIEHLIREYNKSQSDKLSQ